jgi:hypothetical protein
MSPVSTQKPAEQRDLCGTLVPEPNTTMFMTRWIVDDAAENGKPDEACLPRRVGGRINAVDELSRSDLWIGTI